MHWLYIWVSNWITELIIVIEIIGFQLFYFNLSISFPASRYYLRRIRLCFFHCTTIMRSANSKSKIKIVTILSQKLLLRFTRLLLSKNRKHTHFNTVDIQFLNTSIGFLPLCCFVAYTRRAVFKLNLWQASYWEKWKRTYNGMIWHTTLSFKL